MLNERESLLDVMLRERDLTRAYAAFLADAVDPELRKILEKNFGESAKDSHKVFDAMIKNNYSSPEIAEEEELRERKKIFSSVRSSLEAH